MSFPGFPAPPSSGSPSSPGGHNLLSSTHTDTVSGSPSKGDMIVSPTGTDWDILSAGSDGQILQIVSGAPQWQSASFGGVNGPPTSADSSIALFDGTSGNLLKDSLVTIDTLGNITTPGSLIQSGVTINTVSSVITSTYTIGDEYYVALNSGVTQVSMPASPQLGQEHIIKDIDGVASSGNITVDGNGNTIDGLSQILITNNYEAVRLIFGPKEWNII